MRGDTIMVTVYDWFKNGSENLPTVMVLRKYKGYFINALTVGTLSRDLLTFILDNLEEDWELVIKYCREHNLNSNRFKQLLVDIISDKYVTLRAFNMDSDALISINKMNDDAVLQEAKFKWGSSEILFTNITVRKLKNVLRVIQETKLNVAIESLSLVGEE